MALRKHFLEVRAQIASTHRREAALAAAKLLAHASVFLESTRIACYLPVRSEFDTNPLIEAIWAAKKNCFLPILAEKEERFLDFAAYHYGDPLHFNRYNILEPAKSVADISPRELDLVITPLIAFDLKGHRLGTGGGYYDKTFAFLQDGSIKKPIMMGVGFALQEAKNLPSTSLDVGLRYVLTEQKLMTCV